MKFLIFFAWLGAGISACTVPTPPNPADPFSEGRWIDLTYSFSDSTLYWPNNPTGFVLDTQSNGITSAGFYYASNAFCTPEHGGTHLDAPVHFAEGKLSVDKVPLESLTGLAVVIDVSEKAVKDPDYLVSVNDLQSWETVNGAIPENSIVLINTGYGRHYPHAKQYFGTDKKGAAAIPELHFPGMDPEAAEWLATTRKTKAVGLDTPSIDYGQSVDFRSHRVLLGKNIPVFENLANLGQLPVKGSYVVALPMKIKNGSGGPLRIVAWLQSRQLKN